MVITDVMEKLDKVRDPNIRDILLYLIEENEKRKEESIKREEFYEFVRTTNENFKKVWEAIDQLTERIDQLTRRMDRLTERVDQLTERMDQLTKRVDELTERMNQLTERVDQLTERMNQLTKRVDELTERMNQLTERVNQLTERVNQLTKRVDELTERMNQLTERVDQLAEAQKKTEGRLDKVIKEQKAMRKEIGGLAHTFGYFLEDRAYKGLPSILKGRFGIEVTQPLKRIYVKGETNRYYEINIFGAGRRGSEEVYIIGECKAKLSKREVDKFIRNIEKFGDRWKGEKILFLVTYQAPPSVAEYVERRGINLIYSYELPL